MEKTNKKPDSKKVTSIARKINYQKMSQILVEFIAIDILVCVFVIGIFIYSMDMQMFGEFSIEFTRDLIKGDSLEDILYIVSSDKGELLYEIQIGFWIKPAIYAAIIIGIVEMIHILELFIGGTNQIRKKLKPLNEIAIKAHQLSELAFDESKYHNLEDAISNIDIESIDSGIHMHDKDLQGIEIALNELIKRIRASYKQQTQFVSDASHELRTPIAVIQGYVNMLDRWGKDDPAILEESIEAIKNESNHMKRLVDQLLFLARGDSNRQMLDMKKHCLNNIMREVYEESLMIDEKHYYTFEESGMAYVLADCDMLKQSARILIDNAAKYTPEGEEIKISVGVQSDGMSFYGIQDNGIGMTQDDVEHAFDRFYRADGVRNSKTGGTGLGLSIAKWIIDKHQGHYDIVSYVGLGTRFRVILPYQ